MHRHTYRSHGDVHAVIHAHPPGLVAFSICHKIPDTTVLPRAFAICGPVAYASYERTGTDQLGRRVAEALGEDHHCVIMENHGVVTTGRTLFEAFERLETLELTARVIVNAASLGDVRCVDDLGPAGAETLTPTTHQELPKGRDLGAFVRRAYRRHLLTCSLGVFSARLDEKSWIRTGGHFDAETLEGGDLVQVGDPGHDAIYSAHPGVNAVLHAGPPHATASSVTGHKLDSRTIPESAILLRDVASVPYEDIRNDPAGLAGIVSLDRPAAVLGNLGVLVVGASLLEAFDRLEVLEATAASLIRARRLGEPVPLSDEPGCE